MVSFTKCACVITKTRLIEFTFNGAVIGLVDIGGHTHTLINHPRFQLCWNILCYYKVNLLFLEILLCMYSIYAKEK